jgi:hypothetical protein
MRCDTIESNFIHFGNISPFEEEVVYSSSVKMMKEEV